MMVGKAGAASAPPLSALLPHAAALQLVGLLSLAAAAATLTLPGVAAGSGGVAAGSGEVTGGSQGGERGS